MGAKPITNWFEDEDFVRVVIQGGIQRLLDLGASNAKGLINYSFDGAGENDARVIAQLVRENNSRVNPTP